MASQFETVVYLKSNAAFEETAARIAKALGDVDFQQAHESALGGDHYRLNALGFEATIFVNEGEMQDDDFSDYPYGLGLVSTYLDPELEMSVAESALADYYSRLLAFQLDLEVATSFYLGAEDGVDRYEIRGLRRNPQFTLNAGPTAPKTYVSQRRTVEYDSDLAEGDFEEDEELEEVDAE